MEFEIDFGSLQQAARPRERGPVCASIDGMVAQLSTEECVFQVRGSEEVHVMTLDVLRAMDMMRVFRPMEEHVKQIEGQIDGLGGKTEAIERVVDGLRERGLVVTAEQVLEDALADRDRTETPTAILVRTADRPTQLGTLLDSLSELPESAPVVVLDGSTDDAARVANAERVRAVDHRPAHHLDRNWRTRLVDELAAGAEVPAEILGSLLAAEATDFAGGQVWNAGTLLTAGMRPFLLDDDMRWDLRQPAQVVPAVNFRQSARVPMYFAPDEAGLEPGLAAAEGDWFEAHRALCGAPLAALRGLEKYRIDPATVTGQSYSDLVRLIGQTGIKSTCSGYYGDAAMDSRLWFMLTPRPQSLWRSREDYFATMAHPHVAQGFGHVQLAELSHFTPTTMDNSALLPPVAPVGRGEDLTFGALVRYLYPASSTVHLPVLVGHHRETPHSAENPDAFVPQVSRFFAEFALAHADECEAADPEDRAAMLAARFRDIGQASTTRRKTLLREFLGYLRAQIVNQLQRQLTGQPDAPDYWQQGVKDWIEANGRALTEIRAPRLRGWPDDLDADGCAAALAADANRYADWLEVWPRAWHAAHDRFEELIAL